MRRCLFLLSFLFTAAIASAASINWQVRPTTVKDPLDNTTNLANALVVLIQGDSVVQGEVVSSILEQGTAWDYSDVAIATGLTLRHGGGSGENVEASGEVNTTHDFFVVIFDSSTVETSSHYMVSQILQGVLFGGEIPPTMTPEWNSSHFSGWQQLDGEPIEPDVPEPTALALLALGVAGVALRRRVA